MAAAVAPTTAGASVAVSGADLARSEVVMEVVELAAVLETARAARQACHAASGMAWMAPHGCAKRSQVARLCRSAEACMSAAVAMLQACGARKPTRRGGRRRGERRAAAACDDGDAKPAGAETFYIGDEQAGSDSLDDWVSIEDQILEVVKPVRELKQQLSCSTTASSVSCLSDAPGASTAPSRDPEAVAAAWYRMACDSRSLARRLVLRQATAAPASGKAMICRILSLPESDSETEPMDGGQGGQAQGVADITGADAARLQDLANPLTSGSGPVEVQPSEWFRKRLFNWHTLREKLRTHHKSFTARKRASHELGNAFDDEALDRVDIAGVTNIHNADGMNSPIYARFKYEDWILLAWRIELHLLVTAFIRDMEADCKGMPEAHVAHYYEIYFKKCMNVGLLGADSLDRALQILRGPLVLQVSQDGALSEMRSKIAADTGLDDFVLAVEMDRRDRMRRVDAGDESALLRFPRALSGVGSTTSGS